LPVEGIVGNGWPDLAAFSAPQDDGLADGDGEHDYEYHSHQPLPDEEGLADLDIAPGFSLSYSVLRRLLQGEAVCLLLLRLALADEGEKGSYQNDGNCFCF
jgi:hypothetical protein